MLYTKRLFLALPAIMVLALAGCASSWESVADRLSNLLADNSAEIDQREIAVLREFETAAGPTNVSIDPARQRIFDLGNDVVRALGDRTKSTDARVAYFRKLLGKNLDVPLIARFALGRAWGPATENQRKAYVAVFSEFLVQTYSRRLGGIEVRNLEIVDSLAIGDKDTLVRTLISQSTGQPVRADWRLRERGGKLRVLDLSVEGISMAMVMRQEFASILRNRGGIDGLVSLLKQRNS